jgi:hypothetical protein
MNILCNNGLELEVKITGEVIPVRYVTDSINTFALVRWKHIGGNTIALYEVINVIKLGKYEYPINNTAPLYTFNKTF